MLINIMKASIIMHNMIIEYEQIDETPQVQISCERTLEFVEFIQRHLSIRIVKLLIKKKKKKKALEIVKLILSCNPTSSSICGKFFFFF
jgi:hypothetical protein